jgi:hypothetical protein
VILRNFLEDLSESRCSSKLEDMNFSRPSHQKAEFRVRSPFTIKISTNDGDQIDQSSITVGKMFCGYFEM